MNIIKCKRGMTILEVLLAITIFAIVALPLFSVFVQSMNVDRKASDVLNANYVSQDYLEKLDTITYAEALAELPNDKAVGDYSFTARIEPYGTLNSLFGQPCSYVHLIMYDDDDDGSALCVMPDGKWNIFPNVPSSFSLTVSDGNYSFSGGYTGLTGPSKYDCCAMIVNAMRKPDATTSSISLGENCKAALYIKKIDSGEITFSGGSSSVHESIISGNTSLIYVTTALYNPSSETVIATSDGYINIKNW